MSQVQLDLMEFIEHSILPRYAAFDAAHNMEHAVRVIRASMKLARQLGADIDMSYTVAAYHDLGLEGPRAIHHITSGRILKADRRLQKWFSPQQIDIMRQAVEDHRASASRVPRSLYGKIVAEADRDLEPESVFRRTVLYGLDNYPEKTMEEHWLRFQQHMRQKYSEVGYVKLWINGSDNERYLAELRDMIANEIQLRKCFDRIFTDCINAKRTD